jgi:hypothetical protein
MKDIENELHDDEFIYDDQEAARVVLQNVSEELRNKVDLKNMVKILDFKYEYLEIEGFITDILPTPEDLIKLDQGAMDEFIIANARLRKVDLTREDLLEIWEAEGNYFENDDEDSFYFSEEAAEAIYDDISEELQEKLDFEDIIRILEVEEEYHELAETSNKKSVGDRPVDVDAKEYYIINACVKDDIILTYDELREILDAETRFLESEGLIDDDDQNSKN